MIEKRWPRYVFLALNIALAALVISPLVYAVMTSFMTELEIYMYPPRFIPSSFYTDNYVRSLQMAPLFRFVFNSAFVAISCTLAQLITGALSGYAFAILNFRGKKQLFLLILSTMMIPGQAIIIANYLTIANLGMLDSFSALILPYMTSAFCIFNMRQAFLQIPSELNDSAKVDGCNSLQFFIRIALPLTKPSLGSLGIYTFLNVWNQYLWPLLVTNSTEMRTVQIGLGMLKNADGTAIGPIMAGTVIVLVPSIVVFILGQKSLVSGLTAGAVKG